MYAIYGNIYHQYTPNVSIYTSTMDPMGYFSILFRGFSQLQHQSWKEKPHGRSVADAEPPLLNGCSGACSGPRKMPQQIIWVWINTYYYNTIFSGMNIHKSRYFDVNYRGTRVLTHCHIGNYTPANPSKSGCESFPIKTSIDSKWFHPTFQVFQWAAQRCPLQWMCAGSNEYNCSGPNMGALRSWTLLEHLDTHLNDRNP